MKDLIETLIAERVTTLKGARLVEATLVEAGAKHAKVDLDRLREILALVRQVIGPYSEEEKANAKAELDEIAALTGNAPAEGESMVERAARGAIMKARAAGELQGEGAAAVPDPAAAPVAPTAPETAPISAPAAQVAPVAAKPKAAAPRSSVVAPVVDRATGQRVMVQFGESLASEAYDVADSCLIEAVEPTGKVIDVLVIKSGTSMNGRRYRPAVLREAVASGAFEGARSFWSEGTDHVGARGSKALCGWWDNARYVEGLTLPHGRVAEGVAAHYHPTDRNLRETLVAAIGGGRPDLIGFSIFGDGPLTAARENGRNIQDVGRIESIDSIDPVMHPAAGGQALRLVASMESSVDPCKKCGSTVQGHVCAPDVSQLVKEALAEAMAPIIAKAAVETALTAFPDLPAKARERVMTLAESLPDITPESARALIEREAEYVAAFAPASVRGAGAARIEGGQSQHEKFVESVTDVLDGKTNSIKKVYIDLTGDDGMTGRLKSTGRLSEARLSEADILTSTFPLCTAEAMHKRLLAEYRKPGLDNWRKIVSSVGTANDFRTQHFAVVGGYGDLSTVAEAAAYLSVTSPAEDSIVFPALHKVGGLEDLTLEAIANDDVRLFRRIPTSLARAAKRTLYKGVWSVLTTNGNFAETNGAGATPLMNAAHGGNIGTAALSSTALTAARLVMMQQAELTSAEPIGIVPKYLVVPPELEETAWVILNTQKLVGSAENDQSFVSNLGLEVIVVNHWTDATDWYLVADPGMWDTLEVVFFQGREEPELFLQDNPLMGENFTNDVLTYKIRHIWAVGPVDYRPFYRSTVAG